MAVFFSSYDARQQKSPTGVNRLRLDALRSLPRLICGLLCVCLLLAAPPFLKDSLAVDPPQVTQEQLKAVYLYNFLLFVTWPSEQQKTAQNDSKLICLIDNSTAISEALEGLHSNLSLKNTRPFHSKHFEEYTDTMDLSACDILFVSVSEKNHFKEIIDRLNHAPILTVSDSDKFGAAGGMIFFTSERSRLRYKINRTETTAAGLRLNSQLLKSALQVTDK